MKKILFGFLALVLVMGTVAFRNGMAQDASFNAVWYILEPGGDPDNPADYSLASGQEAQCSGSALVCAIKAFPDPSDNSIPRMDGSISYDQQLMNEIDKSQSGSSVPSATYVREKN